MDALGRGEAGGQRFGTGHPMKTVRFDLILMDDPRPGVAHQVTAKYMPRMAFELRSALGPLRQILRLVRTKTGLLSLFSSRRLSA